MKITRTNPFNGEINTINIDVTDEQVQAYMDGALIQKRIPPADSR